MFSKSKGGAKPPVFRPQPLPRGRHRLSAEVVRASQRQRLVQAMLSLVGERGYAATSVPAVTAAARVARNTFYQFFPDKESCFLAACAEAAADGIATMETFGIEADWVVGVRRGMRTWLQWWQERPGFARAYLVELPLVGEGAVRQRENAYQRFEQLFMRLGARVRREQPGLQPLPDFVPRVLVYALLELVAAEVRAGRIGRLTAIEDTAMFVTVKLLADETYAQLTLPPQKNAKG
ncbi:MAG: TetR/AcrR family transcriptional regulator [Nevskiales bacterium]